jgi:hypothetical protein
MVCLLKCLQIRHAHAVINYLCTNILSSLIQIGSQPHMVCIVWHVVGDCHKPHAFNYYYRFTNILYLCI